MLSAIEALSSEGSLTSENLLAKYKEISGSRIRGLNLVSEDFEKGTFMTLNEVLHNPEVDVEKERMMRGYGMKQFLRIKPFLKSAWHEAHPSAPPPMPTFGDIRRWQSNEKPAWAGTTILALPKEVFDAAHKTPEGKPLYPPAWMPIHLMPVWNYVAKKTTDNPYQTGQVSFDQSGPIVSNQASFREGMVVAALRKYVKFRGEGNLVDIPSSKLAEVDLGHADIFRGDSSMERILSHKIIDPVALMPFVKKELKRTLKKSFSLYIREDKFIKSEKIDEKELKKSLIDKIRELKKCRNENYFVKSAKLK